MNTISLPDGTWFNVEDTNIVSDGYHTFGELYEHRCLLWAMIINVYDEAIGGDFGFVPFKTRKNSEGAEWEGWFIAGMNTKDGQITYHLPNDMWDLVDAPEIERNDKYDGHTSEDVVKRIRTFLTCGP